MPAEDTLSRVPLPPQLRRHDSASLKGGMEDSGRSDPFSEVSHGAVLWPLRPQNDHIQFKEGGICFRVSGR